MKLVATTKKVNAVVSVECPFCKTNLGIVPAATTATDDFWCDECGKTFSVIVRMRHGGCADLSFYE